MFPSRCIQEPWRNIDVTMLDTCLPWSVTHTRASPIAGSLTIVKLEPGGSNPVSSPGISPRLQTDAASGMTEPAPWTTSHTSTFAAMSSIVMKAARCVAFSS